jgi:glycosyltransferase involved in cell wall biosynthesis
MFGGYWSLLPALFGRLLHKPVFIILGGSDCVAFPSMGYGGLRKPHLRKILKWSYQLSTRLLPVHQSLVLCDYTYLDKPDYPKQGYKYFLPDINTPFIEIYNGFDSSVWKPVPGHNKKPNTFITVANVFDYPRFIIKGMDVVYKLAEGFPDCKFIIVGLSEQMQQKTKPIPSNLKCYPFLQEEEIKIMYSFSEYYLQLSISEGFPNSLCEAMLCECIPIGSDVGSIPFIISDTGYIVNKKDLKVIEREIESILTASPQIRKELSLRARRRIYDEFTISKREFSFYSLIE